MDSHFTLKLHDSSNEEDQALCFDTAVFHSKSFDVQVFIDTCLKDSSDAISTLTLLKKDLLTYIQQLRFKLVDFLNAQYTEFLNISGTLENVLVETEMMAKMADALLTRTSLALQIVEKRITALQQYSSERMALSQQLSTMQTSLDLDNALKATITSLSSATSLLLNPYTDTDMLSFMDEVPTALWPTSLSFPPSTPTSSPSFRPLAALAPAEIISFADHLLAVTAALIRADAIARVLHPLPTEVSAPVSVATLSSLTSLLSSLLAHALDRGSVAAASCLRALSLLHAASLSTHQDTADTTTAPSSPALQALFAAVCTLLDPAFSSLLAGPMWRRSLAAHTRALASRSVRVRHRRTSVGGAGGVAGHEAGSSDGSGHLAAEGQPPGADDLDASERAGDTGSADEGEDGSLTSYAQPSQHAPADTLAASQGACLLPRSMLSARSPPLLWPVLRAVAEVAEEMCVQARRCLPSDAEAGGWGWGCVYAAVTACVVRAVLRRCSAEFSGPAADAVAQCAAITQFHVLRRYLCDAAGEGAVPPPPPATYWAPEALATLRARAAVASMEAAVRSFVTSLPQQHAPYGSLCRQLRDAVERGEATPTLHGIGIPGSGAYRSKLSLAFAGLPLALARALRLLYHPHHYTHVAAAALLRTHWHLVTIAVDALCFAAGVRSPPAEADCATAAVWAVDAVEARVMGSGLRAQCPLHSASAMKKPEAAVAAPVIGAASEQSDVPLCWCVCTPAFAAGALHAVAAVAGAAAVSAVALFVRSEGECCCGVGEEAADGEQDANEQDSADGQAGGHEDGLCARCCTQQRFLHAVMGATSLSVAVDCVRALLSLDSATATPAAHDGQWSSAVAGHGSPLSVAALWHALWRPVADLHALAASATIAAAQGIAACASPALSAALEATRALKTAYLMTGRSMPRTPSAGGLRVGQWLACVSGVAAEGQAAGEAVARASGVENADASEAETASDTRSLLRFLWRDVGVCQGQCRAGEGVWGAVVGATAQGCAGAWAREVSMLERQLSEVLVQADGAEEDHDLVKIREQVRLDLVHAVRMCEEQAVGVHADMVGDEGTGSKGEDVVGGIDEWTACRTILAELAQELTIHKPSIR